MNLGFLRKKIGILISTMLLVALMASCAPEQRVLDAETEDLGTTSTDTPAVPPESVATVPEVINFLQVGTTRYTQILNLFSDYKDSFLIRGNELTQYLASLPNPMTHRLCLLMDFPGVTGTGSKKVLAMGARVKSYKNFQTMTTEFYLQVEVSNESLNNTDCSSAGILNTISNKYGTSSYALSVAQVCPSCSSTITGSEMGLYLNNGQSENRINIKHLRLSIMPKLGSTPQTGSVCNDNYECQSKGFNCCVEGQCINHGQVKSSTDINSDEYQIALNDILNAPQRIKDYPHLFYICPQYVNTGVDNNQDADPGLDPQGQAAQLFLELQDLYRCTTPQLDEFSICTKEYENASSLINGGSYNFFAGTDDINMSAITSTPYNNIFEVEYGGKLLYREKMLDGFPQQNFTTGAGSINTGSRNDNLTTAQFATISIDKPIDALDDTVRIRYLIDGSCTKIGSNLAKCYKIYEQSQSSNPARSSDHNGQFFKLPDWANTSYNVMVEVEGVQVGKSASTWNIVNNGNGKGVEFVSGYTIFPGQMVKIDYFVSTNVDKLLSSKTAAQNKINTHCACDPDQPCYLKPVYNPQDTSKIINYVCSYEPPEVVGAPLQKSVYISAKTVPHKFYDSNGTYFTPDRIDEGAAQELTKFEYSGNNTIRPNNITSDVGFNEIYGTMKINDTSPMPATVVEVVRGRRYELFVDEGVFASCLDCGSDYYSNINKLFPNNFLHKGGGYVPDPVESRRIDTQSTYRADDLLFGRACFVPATMIPWTHVPNNNITQQRRNRLAAQHFLFANGYNRDWYGFDYGSLIGSFDGVKWFAIGNQRRVQAKSNRLFLAINAYFGDLTTNNSFKVTISESASVIDSGSFVDHDTESDGAQCQSHHFCDTDNDCLTQLGYDYACVNVSALETPWPTFDANGNEVSGSVNTRLITLVDGTNGQAKRCVYRGRGAPCERGLFDGFSANNSYSKTSEKRFNMCSSNNYCAELTSAQFNTKIARYAQSPLAQNNNSSVVAESGKTDQVGLAARLIGRPYKFYGDRSISSLLVSHFDAAGVQSICVPGKDANGATTLTSANDRHMRTADKMFNVGMTRSSTSDSYYALCPGIEADGNYEQFRVGLTNNLSKANFPFAIGQNLSSNALSLDIFSNLGLFNDSNPVTSIGYQRNTCLRSPGSSCFTDLECAPNKFISNRIKSLSNIDSNDLNTAEAAFWKEELVCGRELKRYTVNSTLFNPYYTVKDHTCCREIDKTFTLKTQLHSDTDLLMFDSQTLSDPDFNYQNDNTFDYIKVPGIDMPINDSRRYSRIHSLYPHLTTTDTHFKKKLPPLFSSTNRQSSNNTGPLRNFNLEQFLTLQRHNSKMCCTGAWVRNFNSLNSGSSGGHRFRPSAQQKWDNMDTFRHLSWNPKLISDIPYLNGVDSNSAIPGTNFINFFCNIADVNTSYCEVRNIPQESKYDNAMMKWFGKFELIGIPQVLIESPKHVYRRLDANQELIDANSLVRITDTIQALQTADYADVIISDNKLKNSWGAANLDFDNSIMPPKNESDTDRYFISAGNTSRFTNANKKVIFSPDTFSCCQPTGYEIDADVSGSQCCTGLATDQNGPRRCCLEDYVDLSVYTNLYVSSEGFTFNGKTVGPGDYDPLTGYLKPELVEKMAATMCCSGTFARGIAISNYWIPITSSIADSESTISITQGEYTRRWIGYKKIDSDSGTLAGNSNYLRWEKGQRWNDHVYCVPSGSTGGSTGGGAGSGGSSGSQQ